MNTPARTFILSCGGTGGHLSPGIALAEGLAGRGYKAILLISHKKVDTRLAAKYPGLQFVPIPGTPFGLRPGVLWRFVVSQSGGFVAGWRLLKAERPCAIVGFGGFTTASIIIAGVLRGVPVALHEANRVPGKSVRYLARFARRVYLPHGIKLKSVVDSKLRNAGLPVRAEIARRSRPEAVRSLGLNPAHKVLVVFGGSQGAAPLNNWARDAVRDLASIGVQVACVSGIGKGDAEFSVHAGPDGVEVRSVMIPFCDDVASLLSAADIVVARAGAGSLAEFARLGVPAVLVPFPQAADDHQRANADYFEKQGAGVVSPQERIGELTTIVKDLLASPDKLSGLRDGLLKLDRAAALDFIMDDLEQNIVLNHDSASVVAAAPGLDSVVGHKVGEDKNSAPKTVSLSRT